MYLVTILVLVSLGTIYCLEVIPESTKVTYVNEKYADSVIANIRPFGRPRRIYYMNASGVIKHTWGDNITVHLIFTEYLHNEYRRSFIEFHYKLCDFINYEPYFGGIFKQKGLKCPIPKGPYSFMNMTTQTQDFPNVFPFEKGGVDAEATITETGERVMAGYVHAIFKQKRKQG